MESIFTKLALHGIINMWARIDTVFLHIFEVSNGTVSLEIFTVLPKLADILYFQKLSASLMPIFTGFGLAVGFKSPQLI